jgi:hypothetical protein
MYRFAPALALLCTPLIAQAQSGFPDGFNAASGGVAIGQSADQVQRVFAETFTSILDVDPINSTTIGAPWKVGYRFDETSQTLPQTETKFLTSQGAAEVSQRNMADFTGRYTGAFLSVTYGSALSGHQVEAIKRSQNFDPPLDMRAALEAVDATYGKPHGVVDGAKQVFYGFAGGNPILGKDMTSAAAEIQQRCLSPKSAPRNIVTRAYSGGSYTLAIDPGPQHFFAPNPQRKVKAEDNCDAAMTVTLKLNRDRLVTNIEIYIIDLAAMVVDQKRTEGALVAPAPPVGTTVVPKL